MKIKREGFVLHYLPIVFAVLLGIVFYLSSCSRTDIQALKETMTKSIAEKYPIVVIDGCEYFECRITGYANGTILVHKANCKNMIHKFNPEMFW